MTREELVEQAASLNKELEEARKELAFYKDWKDRETAAHVLAEKKLLAAKAFFEVV